MTDTRPPPMKLILISRDSRVLSSIGGIIAPLTDVVVQRRHLASSTFNVPSAELSAADAIVLHVAAGWSEALHALAERRSDRRPSLIVIGTLIDTTDLRLAMQAGARDMLPEPIIPADLLAAVKRTLRDRRTAGTTPEASLTAFINAKGGCGATLIASNVAHAQAALAGRRAAILDLDLQFGAIPIYFDLFPKRGVLHALENIDSLDETALGAYMAHHESGLDILGASSDESLPLDADVKIDRLRKLLDLIARQHDQIVIDLPRRIDPATSLIFERSNRIVLIVQQSVAVLRDAGRLMSALRRDLAIGADRIVTVVNRYDRHANITPDDIRRTLSVTDLSLIPNDYRTVSESIDTGRPLLASARSKPITKAITQLQERLEYGTPPTRPGIIARAISQLIPSSSL